MKFVAIPVPLSMHFLRPAKLTFAQIEPLFPADKPKVEHTHNKRITFQTRQAACQFV